LIEFVLDCSVAISWCLVDENDNYANEVLKLMSNAKAFVPGIWSLEIANTLLVAERRNRLKKNQSDLAIILLQSLNISVDNLTAKQALNRTLKLGRIYNLASYDAAYLELAIRLGLPLATLDIKLSQAAQSSGVILFNPHDS
jgi:predicted nucleic acid-binding protein